MKRFLFFLVFLFLCFSLHAKSDSVNFDKVKFGMGTGMGLSVSILDEYYYEIPTLHKIVMPIQIYKKLRIEPVFSFSFSRSNNNEDERTDGFANFLVGSGIFFTHPINSTMINAGVRIAGGASIFYRDEDDETDRNRHRGILLVEPVVGADYFFNDHFSIGTEIALSFIYFGKTASGNDNYKSDETTFHIRVGGSLLLRFYFF